MDKNAYVSCGASAIISHKRLAVENLLAFQTKTAQLCKVGLLIYLPLAGQHKPKPGPTTSEIGFAFFNFYWHW
jgi:hypothetical protein